KICFIEITSVSGVSPAAATIASVEAPPKLTVLERDGEGRISLQIEGTAARQYVLEVSDDLLHWTPLGTLENTTGTVQFLDTESTVVKRRYYRAVLFAVEISGTGHVLNE